MKHGYTIGFDAHEANSNNTDLGNYSRFIIESLATATPRNSYVRLYVGHRAPNAEYERLAEQPNIESMEPDGLMWRKMPQLWRRIRLAADAKRGDVALFHGLTGVLPYGLSRRNIRSVVTIHDLAFLHLHSYYNPLERAWLRATTLDVLLRADRIVAVSNFVKRDIVRLFAIDPDKIDVIYRGCSPAFATIPDEEQCQRIMSRYSLPKEYILTVGTQSERKNTRLIIEAMSKLGGDKHLVIVGRGTGNSTQLQHRINSLGLENRVHMLHGVASDDLPAIYRTAKLFVYASLYEGFAQSIVEALTMGTPVIATRGSSHEEAGGTESIYVSAKSHEELAEAMMRILGDEELHQRMSVAGREYASRFRSEVIAYNLLNCYRRIGIDLTW